MRSSDIHIRAISLEMPQPSITKMRLKITYLKCHWNFPGVNVLKYLKYTVQILNIFRGWMKMLSPISSGWYWVSSSWHHQMETFFALLALCVGNSPVTGEFPAQRAVTWRFDVFFDLRLNKRLSKQSWSWWFETPSRSLWRHCKFTYFPVCVSDRNVMQYIVCPWLPSKMAIRCPLYPSIPVMRQCIDTITASHDPDGGAQGQSYSLHSWLI